MEGSKCWDTGIGSEAFITYLTEQHLVNHTLTVTAQKCAEKAVVYQYQPRDCLYREIVSKCPMNVGGRQKVEQEGGRQRWMVFTGEGRLDYQTAMGKSPVGIAKMAKKYGAKLIALAGAVIEGAQECNEQGIDAYFPILRQVVTLDEAMDPATARKNMVETTEQVMRLVAAVK